MLATIRKHTVNNNSSSNSNTKTTCYGLPIDAHENIDGQNNNVNKELKESTLTIEKGWVLL